MDIWQFLSDILLSRTWNIIVTFPLGALAFMQLREIYKKFSARRRGTTTQEESDDDNYDLEKMFGKTITRFLETNLIVLFVCHVLINFILTNEVLLYIFRILFVSYVIIIGVAVIYKTLKYYVSRKKVREGSGKS